METFPIVRRRDEARYGEYRTKRLILEIYDAMQSAIETGEPYQTILDPPLAKAHATPTGWTALADTMSGRGVCVVSDDLRRPGDAPEATVEPADRPTVLSDFYADDRDDIFDTVEADNVGDDVGDADDVGDPESDWPFDFDPRRAGLPEVSAEEAAAYIAANMQARPWLAPAADRHPQVQRVYAALDQGQGHAIPRHDDFGGPELYERRVRLNEDPAQLDDAKRAAGIDGTKPGNKKHFCAAFSSRIHEADAFAMAFARGIEHQVVRDKLDQRYDAHKVPKAIPVPIADLLGPDGHTYCSGFQLIGNSQYHARLDREAWLAGDRKDGLAEPRTEPIPTFKGGDIEFRFRHNKTHDGYEVSTMFPQPPETPHEQKENK